MDSASPTSDYDATLPAEAVGLAHLLQVLALISWTLNVYAIYICVRTHGLMKTMSVRLAMLIIANETFKITIIVGTTSFLIRDRSYRALQHFGCQIYGVITIMCFAMCGIALICIALERYLLIRGNEVSGKHLLLMNAGGFSMALGLACSYVLFGSGMSISPSWMYCICKWESRALSDIILNIMTMGLTWNGILIIFASQYVIHKAHLDAQSALEKLRRGTKSRPTSSPLSSYFSTDDRANRNVLRLRFYTLSLAAMLGWVPFGIQSVYQMIAGVRVTFYCDAATTTTLSLSSLALIILQIMFTPLIRQRAEVHWAYVRAWATRQPVHVPLSTPPSSAQGVQRSGSVLSPHSVSDRKSGRPGHSADHLGYSLAGARSFGGSRDVLKLTTSHH